MKFKDDELNPYVAPQHVEDTPSRSRALLSRLIGTVMLMCVSIMFLGMSMHAGVVLDALEAADAPMSEIVIPTLILGASMLHAMCCTALAVNTWKEN